MRLTAAQKPVQTSSLMDRLLANTASQKSLIVATLKTSDNVWFETGDELHKAVKRVHGIDINKNSFLPYLSGLKADGIIVREGQRIALADRLKPR